MQNPNLKIPTHIGIIMDGNGRWAQAQNKPRVFGHRQGAKQIRDVAIRANELGVKLLTLYAFSTENWSRPQDEVAYLMSLPKLFFDSYIKELMKENVKVECIGDVSKLPTKTLNIIEDAMERTKDNTGLVLNFALNYGGRQELTSAARLIAQSVLDGEIEVSEIDEDLFASKLETARYGEHSDVDLMIRTSGEERTSNFLPWQLAYSEFYFTETYWPDFGADELDKAIEAYTKRDRRFGKV